MARYAFVVGSNGSPNLGSVLKYAEHDADTMQKLLKSDHCGFKVVRPNLNRDRYALQRQLDEFVSQCQPNDEFLFFFSGHGTITQGELQLLWSKNGSDPLKAFLPARLILDSVKSCAASNRLVILDCCHAGAVAGMKASEEINFEEVLPKPDNFLILMASGRLEKARELDHLGAGFLTSALRKGLRESFQDADQDRDGRISVTDLKYWFDKETTSHNSKAALLERVPQPSFFGRQKGEFYLTQDVGKWVNTEVQWSNDTTMIVLPVNTIALGKLENLFTVCIGKHPVTNAEYHRFTKATGWREPSGSVFRENSRKWEEPFEPWDDSEFNAPDQPVVCIDSLDALKYCQWVQGLNSKLYTFLPSTQLWGKSIMEFKNSLDEYWFDDDVHHFQSVIHDQALTTALIDVTGRRSNTLGISDMLGNVWQWCLDDEISIGASGAPEENQMFSVRGGGYLDKLERQIPRMYPHELLNGDKTRHSDLGFRIAGCLPSKTLSKIVRKRLDFCRPNRYIHISIRKVIEFSSQKLITDFEESDEIKPGLIPDDPWKGVFGKTQANGRIINAQVTVVDNNYCAVKVQVKSTNPNNPLSGDVKFFLYPDFTVVYPLVSVSEGVAELEFMAHGAFTIGALADAGRTRLEFDLMDTNAPDWFKLN